MYTSWVFVALTGALATGESLSIASPAWHSDYEKALRVAEEDHKPLAIFIGRGEDGYVEVSRKGELPSKAAHVLEKDYVCLYVDTGTRDGKDLAAAFEMSGPGLVLSDAGAKRQAFRHKGELSNRDLTRYLARYADPKRPVKRTDYHRPAVRRAPVMMAPMRSSGGC
jgi:hypothetical protein